MAYVYNPFMPENLMEFPDDRCSVCVPLRSIRTTDQFKPGEALIL